VTRRALLRLAGVTVLVMVPVVRAVTGLWRRSGSGQVQPGGSGGPVITVIPLPEDGIPGPNHLAG